MTDNTPAKTTNHDIDSVTDIKADDFIFFGSSRLSVIVLDELMRRGIKPKAIVTTPDRPKGRKLILTPPEVKVFGIKNNIPVFQFEKLNSSAGGAVDADGAGGINAIEKLKEFVESSAKDSQNSSEETIKYFLVASYGLIIPQAVLDIPPYGTLNIHPSLLPQYRGATPIQQAIIDDMRDTGVTIMLMDAKMDHGPILLQEKRNTEKSDAINSWPKKYADLEEELALQGARMVADNIGDILDKKIQPIPQDHSLATFTKKIEKSDGLLDIEKLKGAEGYAQFLKFNAYYEWPTSYFFVQTKTTKPNSETIGETMRIKVTDAIWDEESKEMKIIKVVPEGQKETLWSEFKKKL